MNLKRKDLVIVHAVVWFFTGFFIGIIISLMWIKDSIYFLK